ncbi:dihydrodipicolinate synthase family protein [Pirellulales bacterium]|nr:dihydrodipicolinate synthase family protein [Pirellulales bacterium]
MQHDLTQLHGITPAIMTPLHEDGSFDEQGMEKLVEHVVAAGVSTVFTLGVAGEYAVFNTDARKRIVDTVTTTVAGRAPVIVGVTGTSTDLVLENIEAYAGKADYVLSTPPDFLDMSQTMCREFASRVADASPVPLILYNCPLSRNYVQAETMAELADHPNIAAVKETSSMVQLNDMRAAMKGRTDFVVMSGNEYLFYPALCMGIQSFIMGGPGNILPALCVDIYRAYRQGDVEKTREQTTEFVTFLQKFYGIPGGEMIPGALSALKGGLSIMGLCGPSVGHPNLPVNEAQLQQIGQLMDESGLFCSEAVNRS